MGGLGKASPSWLWEAILVVKPAGNSLVPGAMGGGAGGQGHVAQRTGLGGHSVQGPLSLEACLVGPDGAARRPEAGRPRQGGRSWGLGGNVLGTQLLLSAALLAWQ